MRLELTPAPSWRLERAGRLLIFVVGGPDLVVAHGELVPMEDDEAAWQARALATGLDPGAPLERIAESRARTRTGWPMALVEARAGAERRLAAFYSFFEYRGLALVRAASVERLDAERATILEVLATGQPSWRSDGEVHCLAHVYD